MLSRLFCCDILNAVDEFAEHCIGKRQPKRPLALSDDIKHKSKAVIGAERATSSMPKNLSELFGCEESVHVGVCCGAGERCMKKRRAGKERE